MGGKSSGGDAPDPRLAEAQIRSMGIQDSAVSELLGLQREMAPLQKAQLEQALAATNTAQRESAEDRAWMLARRGALTTAQDGLIDEASRFDTEAKREELAGEAMADVNRAFGSARGQQTRDLARMGVNPGSGRALAIGEQGKIAQALELARAGTQTRQMAREEGRQLKRGVADMLAGYPGMASGQTGAGVGYGTAGVGLVNNSMAGQMQPTTAAAGIAGQMGSNATSMFGAQSQREQAMRQTSEGWGSKLGGIGSLLGGAAKVYTAFLAPKSNTGSSDSSDRRLKTAIQAVGTDERTGLTLYEFEYRTHPGTRFRGVMADEVRRVMPSAVSTDRNGFDQVNYGLLGIEFTVVDADQGVPA